jgi:hypothetical protein
MTGNTTTAFHHLDNHAALSRMIAGIRDGHYQSLVLLGTGGLGKSSVTQEILGKHTDGNPFDPNTAVWIEGNVSPVQAFVKVYYAKNRTLVFDDTPDLAKSPMLVSLLRQLMDTRATRTVTWMTSTPILEREGVPQSFETTSPIVLLSNQWGTNSDAFRALETRSIVVKFTPTPENIHREAGKHRPGYHPDVYRYIGERIRAGDVHQLNYRDYVIASQLHANAVEWKEWLEVKFTPLDYQRELEQPSEVIKAWVRRNGKTLFTETDLLHNIRMFRQNRRILDDTLSEMIASGEVKKTMPPPKKMGRPARPRFILIASEQACHPMSKSNKSRVANSQQISV